jgi:hypothetical protein
MRFRYAREEERLITSLLSPMLPAPLSISPASCIRAASPISQSDAQRSSTPPKHARAKPDGTVTTVVALYKARSAALQ